MRKQIISLSLLTCLIMSPSLCFAKTNYNVAQPVAQPAPAVYQNYGGYQTQYPLPVNSYQTQGYDSAYSNNYNNYNPLQGNVVMVPANTSFEAISLTPLSSEYAKVGDNVSFYLGSDFYYGNHLIAGAGSKVNGTVIYAKKGKLAHLQGKLQIRFTNIVTPTGQMIPILASVQTTDGSGVLKAGTVKDTSIEYTKDAVVGAGLGAALGTAMGALSGGSVGKGAIYGTAVGGGMGLLQNVFDRGNNVEIPQNAQMTIILDQPITVTANTPY